MVFISGRADLIRLISPPIARPAALIEHSPIPRPARFFSLLIRLNAGAAKKLLDTLILNAKLVFDTRRIAGYNLTELGNRLEVGQQTLDLHAKVRLLLPQPFFAPKIRHASLRPSWPSDGYHRSPVAL